MKKLLYVLFSASLLFTACDDDVDDDDIDDVDVVAIDDMDDNDGMNNNDMASGNNGNYKSADMSEDEYLPEASTPEDNDRLMRMYRYDTYTPVEIRTYRVKHNETDWGTTAGYYPEASNRELTQEDVKYLSDWGHKVMMNEIYARNGKIFTDAELKQHFATQGWYSAKSANVQDKLSATERKNLEFLRNNPPS